MVAAPVGTFLYTFLVEPHWLQITTSVLPVRDLPAELEGCTLAHLSDLHIGPQVSDEYIVSSMRLVAGMRPDIVVFTGDWITYAGAEQYDQLARVLENVPAGRLGTVGILGNHDYGHGWRMLPVADRVTEIVRNAGVTLLRDEAVSFGGLQIIGLDDMWSPRFRATAIMRQAGGNPASIVLCHNPDAADRDVWGEFKGWILAGHTHGGQCKPPFLPPPQLPVRNRRYTSGAFELSGERSMYISRGVGHLLKVRFNARPEIPVFTLRRA